MTPDDLDVGMLVTPIKHRCSDRRNCVQEFSGHPFRVVVISMPFAILEDCNDLTRTSVDLRVWELGKISREYVESLVGRQLKVVPHCEKCCEPMTERRCGKRVRWVCAKCKTRGEFVDNNAT